MKALVESPGWSALVNEVLLYGDAPPAQEHLPAGPFTVGPFVDQGDGTVKASLTTPEMMLLPSREQRERAQAWLAGKLTADALHFPPMPCFLCDATPCICGRAL